jgi:phage portal protein BeeE
MSLLRDLMPNRTASRSSMFGGLDSFLFNGNQYPITGMNQTLGTKIEDIDVGYQSLAWRAYMSNPVVFACMRVRRDLFTEARFGYQNMRGGVPGDFYGDRDRPNSGLALLDRPWPGATTGDLLKYLITDNDLAGNAFVARRGGRLVRLRPDWTQIIHGSPDPESTMWDLDSEVMGYAYQPGGPSFGRPWVFLQASEVAHFSTTPDPLLPVRGMSWLSPLLREIMADEAMTEHRLKYFEHGGTPNLVVKTQYTDVKKLKEFMDFVRQEHEGLINAYKMMGFTAGVDATVVGSDLKQLDFKVVQGGGETRIASDAGVPAILAGLSEGLQGSSLNAGQGFSASMRLFADLTMSSAWRNAAGSLEQIIRPPTGARLWYDIRGIPALREDIKSAAEVQALQSTAIRTLTDGGYDAESVVDAIVSGDLKRLTHTGLLSVQLNPPNTKTEPAPVPEALLPFVKPAADEPSPEDVPAPKRDAALLELVGMSARQAEASERRADAAERQADREREPQPPTVVNVTVPEQPVTVTIERGAVQVDAPVTVEAPIVNVAAPEVTVEPPQLVVSENAIQVVEHVPMQTIIDRDPETGVVTGSHEVPVTPEEPSE